MQKKLKLAVLALCYSPLAFAQNTETSGTVAKGMDESAFTFTEAQLGEDDDMSDNVTIMNSNSNVSVIVLLTRNTTMSISMACWPMIWRADSSAIRSWAV